MSKHVRVPAPIQKVIPRIIRSTTGRLFLLVGSCAAVLALGGSHYLLTRTTVTPETTKPTTTKPSDAKVLGSATTEHLDDTTRPATPTTATPATTATTTTPAASAPKQATSESDSTNASFDIEIGKITRSRTSLLLTVPFEIERHGGLSTPIVPGDVSITSNGLLITVQVQSKMLSDNSGVLTILPIGITSGTLNGHFSASSGSVMAGATFKFTL